MRRFVLPMICLALTGFACSTPTTSVTPAASSTGSELDCAAALKDKTLDLVPTTVGNDILFKVGFREPLTDQDIEYHCVYQGITWYVVRGNLPDPTYDANHHWYYAAGKYSMVRAQDVPPGTYHFRLCAHYAYAGPFCLQYSDDVEVDVR